MRRPPRSTRTTTLVPYRRSSDLLGIDFRAARLRMFIFLEHDDARALAHHETVAALVIGTARLFGGVVAAHVQRARLREAGDPDRADRRFGAASQHDVGIAVLAHARRLHDPKGPRRKVGADRLV